MESGVGQASGGQSDDKQRTWRPEADTEAGVDATGGARAQQQLRPQFTSLLPTGINEEADELDKIDDEVPGSVTADTTPLLIGEDPPVVRDPEVAAAIRTARRRTAADQQGIDADVPLGQELASLEEPYDEPEQLYAGDPKPGVPIEAFHLRREREEGVFDESGNYTEARRSDTRDAWLDSLEGAVQGTQGDAAASGADVNVEPVEEKPAKYSEPALWDLKVAVTGMLHPGETVLDALRRLRGTSGEATGKPRVSGRSVAAKPASPGGATRERESLEAEESQGAEKTSQRESQGAEESQRAEESRQRESQGAEELAAASGAGEGGAHGAAVTGRRGGAAARGGGEAGQAREQSGAGAGSKRRVGEQDGGSRPGAGMRKGEEMVPPAKRFRGVPESNREEFDRLTEYAEILYDHYDPDIYSKPKQRLLEDLSSPQMPKGVQQAEQAGGDTAAQVAAAHRAGWGSELVELGMADPTTANKERVMHMRHGEPGASAADDVVLMGAMVKPNQAAQNTSLPSCAPEVLERLLQEEKQAAHSGSVPPVPVMRMPLATDNESANLAPHLAAGAQKEA